MTTSSLGDYVRLYRFTSGRREHAISRVAKLADGTETLAPWPELKALCQDAIAHEQGARDLKRRWEVQKKMGASDPRLAELDPQIDATLGSLSRTAGEIARTFPDTPKGQAAAEFLKQALPNGATGIIHLPYPEQERQLADLVRDCREGGPYADPIALLGLGDFVDRLDGLNTEFGDILHRGKARGIEYVNVQAADQEGQDRLLEIVAKVLGRFSSRSAADAKARAEYLAPIAEQNEAIGLALRNRRPVRDVNPATGVEINEDLAPDAAAPTAAPAPTTPELAPA